ncbi:unnamed protein product [Lathyrus sativus]|nr:unnamed protein product [Lathyrus sativus]
MFNVVFYPDGEFVSEKIIFYRGGVQSTVHEQNIEKWGLSEVMNIILDWGYERNKFRVWSKLEGISVCYFEINKDHRVIDVATYVVGNSTKGHLYVEHNVKDIKVKVVEPQCIDVTVRNESSYEYADESDNDARNVKFNDNEEDKTTGLNDEFEVVEVDMPKEGSNRIDINGKSYRIKMCGSKLPMKKKKLTPKKKMKVKVKVMSPAKKSKDVSEEKDHKPNDDGEDQYVSDELGSSDPDTSEDEKLPKYEKFRKERLGKDYENPIKSKVVVNKLQTREKVRIADIMQDMRKNYSIGITPGRA